jgi:hypothetical protein
MENLGTLEYISTLTNLDSIDGGVCRDGAFNDYRIPDQYRPINPEFIRIPDALLMVIKKFCPDILEIYPTDVLPFNNFNPYDNTNGEKFRISLKLLVKNNRVGPKEMYEKLINHYYIMTYPDLDFVYFSVVSVDSTRDKTNRERFIGLFLK